jgi:hypothetical protein
MEFQPDLSFLRLVENIRHHFAFLFRRGFQIVSVIFVDENYEDWQVTIATDDCIIKIYSYMGKVDLALSIPQLYHVIGLLELSDLIHGVNGDEDFSAPAQDPPMNEAASLLRIAQLLEKYIDNILENIKKMLDLLSINDHPTPPSKLGQIFQYN